MGGCHLSARHRGRRDVEEEEEGGGEGKHDLAPMISTGAHPEVTPPPPPPTPPHTPTNHSSSLNTHGTWWGGWCIGNRKQGEERVIIRVLS